MVAAQESSEHEFGDLVDIRYDPPNEDTTGWRGPAQIASVIIGECNVTVMFQGKTFDRRHQEVRAHVPYLVCLATFVDHTAIQWNIIRREVECLSTSFRDSIQQRLASSSAHEDI